MSEKNPLFSIISPVYGCKTCLYELYSRLVKNLEKITSEYEIILVNDASPDGAWETIKEIADKDRRVKGINLSRNFGQHSAITAGLDYCQGEWIVVIDCDLQDQPEEILRLYDKAKEGFDVVQGRRIERKDNFLKRSFSKWFYKLLGYLTNTFQDSSIANFGIYHKSVIDAIRSMGDYIRYFPSMAKWVGFKQTCISVEHSARLSGKTSYSLKKLIYMAIDVMLSFSDKPLRLTIKFGLFLSSISFLFAIFILIKHIGGRIVVPGWTSVIVSIWFLSGVIIFVLGVVGLYIGKTFDKAKQRPIYIIRESLNISQK